METGGLPATSLCRAKDITLICMVMRDLEGRVLFVLNSFILNNKLANYTRTGFVTIGFQLRQASIEDIEKVKRIVLEEADRDPYILPYVKGEERRAIAKVLEMTSFRSPYAGGAVDMSDFDHRVSMTDLQRSRTAMTVKVRIRKVNLERCPCHGRRPPAESALAPVRVQREAIVNSLPHNTPPVSWHIQMWPSRYIGA